MPLVGGEGRGVDHCNPSDLEEKIQAHPCGGKGLVVTDGLFSVDGDIAPIPRLVEITRRYRLLLMVDDAHATGVLGKHGAGTADHFGLTEGIDISVGTFSKALASEGGFVAGSRALVDYLANTARSFIFSTALSPLTIAVSKTALEIVKSEPERREHLLSLAKEFRRRLMEAGFDVEEHPTPIISVSLGRPDLAVDFSRLLMGKGIFVGAIRPPTVPPGTSRLRVNLMATHSPEDLQWAFDCIVQTGRTLGVIGGR